MVDESINQIRMKKVLQKAKVEVETKNLLILTLARFFGVLAVLLAPLFKNISQSTKRR